ncbi:MAG: hypothetical protein Q9222_004748 [Ikaeria aurantiellina]
MRNCVLDSVGPTSNIFGGSGYPGGRLEVTFRFSREEDHGVLGIPTAPKAATATEYVVEQQRILFDHIRMRFPDRPRAWKTGGVPDARNRTDLMDYIMRYCDTKVSKGRRAEADIIETPQVSAMPSIPRKRKASDSLVEVEYDGFLKRAEALRSAVEHDAETKRQELIDKHNLEAAQLEKELAVAQEELDEMISQRTETLKPQNS